jgi:hypothetical protein
MAAFLMPWKRVTVKVGTADAAVNLYSLMDLFHIPDENLITMTGTDPGIHDKVVWLLSMTVVLLVFTILAFVGGMYYPRRIEERLGVDTIVLVLSVTVLGLAVGWQNDFDALWKYSNSTVPAGTVVDWEQTFLVVGPMAGLVAINLGLVFDKAREVLGR